jgi:hypothetical protein
MSYSPSTVRGCFLMCNESNSWRDKVVLILLDNPVVVRMDTDFVPGPFNRIRRGT